MLLFLISVWQNKSFAIHNTGYTGSAGILKDCREVTPGLPLIFSLQFQCSLHNDDKLWLIKAADHEKKHSTANPWPLSPNINTLLQKGIPYTQVKCRVVKEAFLSPDLRPSGKVQHALPRSPSDKRLGLVWPWREIIPPNEWLRWRLRSF